MTSGVLQDVVLVTVMLLVYNNIKCFKSFNWYDHTSDLTDITGTDCYLNMFADDVKILTSIQNEVLQIQENTDYCLNEAKRGEWNFMRTNVVL